MRSKMTNIYSVYKYNSFLKNIKHISITNA